MLLAVLASLSLALRKRLKVLGAQLKSGHLRLEQLLIALAAVLAVAAGVGGQPGM